MELFGNAKVKVRAVLAAFALTIVALPAVAEAPKGVADMLKTAAAANDKVTFDTVLSSALATWPKKRGVILKLADGISHSWMSEAYLAEIEAAKAAVIAAEAASKARGVMHYLDPKLWKGQAQFGANASTGDSDEQGLSVALSFDRAFGDRWNHSLDFKFDMARNDGATTRQKFVTQYEAMWKPWKDVFLLSFSELELDRFSGYDYRVIENIAVGTSVFKNSRHSLRLEGGPGMRFTRTEASTTDGILTPAFSDTEFLGRVASTYDLKISDNMSLRDRTSAIFGTESTTLENWLSFSARINAHLTARLSFDVKYDSVAPVGTAAWDTATRATLVYDF